MRTKGPIGAPVRGTILDTSRVVRRSERRLDRCRNIKQCHEQIRTNLMLIDVYCGRSKLPSASVVHSSKVSVRTRYRTIRDSGASAFERCAASWCGQGIVASMFTPGTFSCIQIYTCMLRRTRPAGCHVVRSPTVWQWISGRGSDHRKPSTEKARQMQPLPWCTTGLACTAKKYTSPRDGL